MAVQIIEAEYFEEESKVLGATNANIKSVRPLVQAAIEGRSDIVSFEAIRNTAGEKEFRPWVRVRGKKSGVRIAIELFIRKMETILC